MPQALAHAAKPNHGQHGLGTVICFGFCEPHMRRQGFTHVGTD
jgi:hypothetical protein